MLATLGEGAGTPKNDRETFLYQIFQLQGSKKTLTSNRTPYIAYTILYRKHAMFSLFDVISPYRKLNEEQRSKVVLLPWSLQVADFFVVAAPALYYKNVTNID